MLESIEELVSVVGQNVGNDRTKQGMCYLRSMRYSFREKKVPLCRFILQECVKIEPDRTYIKDKIYVYMQLSHIPTKKNPQKQKQKTTKNNFIRTLDKERNGNFS